MDVKRLNWVQLNKEMKIIMCYNKDAENLGRLEYERVGAHMHWCWYQEQDIRMSLGCLEEVRMKQKELFRMKNVKMGEIK